MPSRVFLRTGMPWVVGWVATKFLLALAVLCLLAWLSKPAGAQSGPGDLMVAPTRVVFEGRDRNAEINLVNLGTEPATYRVSFVEMRMDELGGMTEFAEAEAAPGERSAAGLIRFSPRQVLLEPRVAQTIRLQLRKPEGLEEGEYRSHLLFRSVPEGAPPAAGDEAPESLTVDLRPIYGVSIPIIVRHGAIRAEARLKGLQLLPAGQAGAEPALAFTLERSGKSSLFGDLEVVYLPAGAGGGKAAAGQGAGRRVAPPVLGAAKGLAVYSPNASRSGALLLHLPPGLGELAGLQGELRLTYSAARTGEILAEAVLALP